MKTSKPYSNEEKSGKSIPIKAGLIIVIIQWICWLIVPNFVYGMTATATMVFGNLAGGLAVLVWWSFFSRTKMLERLVVLSIIFLTLLLFPQWSHDSIRTGMDGLMFYVYAVPTICMALVVWAFLQSRLTQKLRYITMIFLITGSGFIWLLVQSNGLSGNAKADLSWRWSELQSEKYMDSPSELLTANNRIIEIQEVKWPGFRGPNRDGVIHGTTVETDWSDSPPEELWRRQVGSGCSSFAVQGDFIFTQEQRGGFETVTCYELNSGTPVWMHEDSVRFYDQHAGAGPRSTPTLNNGRVYTLGATGILNVLNINDGSLIWSGNAANETGSKHSGWGYTSSPLVVNNRVVVATAANLICYHIDSGKILWTCRDTSDSFCSAHLVTIDGTEQMVFMCGSGAKGIDLDSGNILWEHPWDSPSRILQPAFINSNEIIINSGNKKGIRRIHIENGNMGWTTDEIWTSNRIRPDFNDFVIHKNHIFGYDGPNLACAELENGRRKWRGARYGGQLILLSDMDMLLVLSEKGEIALVKADPNEFVELSKFKAIEGKTWNHPVIADNILLVRNAKEMVAYQL